MQSGKSLICFKFASVASCAWILSQCMCIILQLWNLATASQTKNNTLLKLLSQRFFPLTQMDLILEW